MSVASSPTLSAHLMPQCIARCRQESPGIDLQLLGIGKTGHIGFAGHNDPVQFRNFRVKTP